MRTAEEEGACFDRQAFAFRGGRGWGRGGQNESGEKRKERNKTKNENSSRWPSERPPASPRPRAVPGSGRPGPPSGGRRGACPASRGRGASLFLLLLLGVEGGGREGGTVREREKVSRRALNSVPLFSFLSPPFLTAFELMQGPVCQGGAELHAVCESGAASEAA